MCARGPADLEVIALANFPQPPIAAVPVTWLGFATGRLIQPCIERLDQPRRGQTTPARFEEEYTARRRQRHPRLVLTLATFG